MFATTQSRELAQGTTRVVPCRELAPNSNTECLRLSLGFCHALIFIIEGICFLFLQNLIYSVSSFVCKSTRGVHSSAVWSQIICYWPDPRQSFFGSKNIGFLKHSSLYASSDSSPSFVGVYWLRTLTIQEIKTRGCNHKRSKQTLGLKLVICVHKSQDMAMTCREYGPRCLSVSCYGEWVKVV